MAVSKLLEAASEIVGLLAAGDHSNGFATSAEIAGRVTEILERQAAERAKHGIHA